MNVILLDKTVHSLDREKHRALTWVMANDRIVKKENKRKYLLRKDYYGFYPLKPLRSKQFRRNDIRLINVIDIADNSDILYYADTYGVFFNDWYQGINRSRRSRKLYGGLNNTDYLMLVEMRKRNKLVILEHNSINFPTDAFERYRVETDHFHMKTSGWVGQYYSSLDSIDVPPWLVSMYSKKYRQSWGFTNPGIVFLKGENDVVILEEGTHLNNAMPYITSDPALVEKYGLADRVPYLGPFDVIDQGESNKILSSFNFDVTEDGESVLDRFLMITPEIPAVIADTATGNTMYFCGDFATGKIAPWTASFGSLSIIKGLLYSKDDVNDPRRFFWLYYKPLLEGIFGDYYESLDN